MSVYNQVVITRPKRAVHNLSHNVKTDARIGEVFLISRPIECVPGDTMKVGNISEVQMAPMVAPSKGELYYETFCFFVSNDMLQGVDTYSFTEILSSMLDDSPKSLPVLNSTSEVQLRSYAEQMGIPAGFVPKNKNLIAYPFRAIFKIYNDWIRDENLQSEIAYSSSEYLSSNRLKINYKKDKFTSLFSSPQKGKELKMPIGNYAPLVVISPQVQYPNKVFTNSEQQSGNHPFVYENASNLQGLSATYVNTTDDRITQMNNNVRDFIKENLQVDLRDVTGVSINDLRLYNKMQKWEERLQLYGSRPKEFLLGNYGIAPNDERLDRPVLIGHTRQPVIISNVTAHEVSSNTSTEFSGFQGSKAGNGSASSQYYYGKWLCKEFGWIITIGVLRPKANYQGGVHRSLFKSNIYDYFNPVFQTLGQVPVKKGEIRGLTSDFNGVLGYTDPYNELRGLEDMTTGVLTDSSLEPFSISRKFAQDPSIADLLPVNATEYDYLFEVEEITLSDNTKIPAPHALIESQMVVKAVRPVSKYPTKSL